MGRDGKKAKIVFEVLVKASVQYFEALGHGKNAKDYSKLVAGKIKDCRTLRVAMDKLCTSLAHNCYAKAKGAPVAGGSSDEEIG
jgi:hypothetical protein